MAHPHLGASRLGQVSRPGSLPFIIARCKTSTEASGLWVEGLRNPDRQIVPPRADDDVIRPTMMGAGVEKYC